MDTQERTLDNGPHQYDTTIRRKGRKVHIQGFSPRAREINEACQEMRHDIRDRSGGRAGQRLVFHTEEAAAHFTKYVGRM
jgi:hypothetical protein